MRILFNARNDPWNRQCHCHGCQSKLEIVASDLTFVADQRDGNAYTFTCPVCQCVGWINSSLVPRGIVPGH
jgi:hypothetical protein